MTLEQPALPRRVKVYRAAPGLVVGNVYQVRLWNGFYAHLITGPGQDVVTHFSRLLPPCPPEQDV